MKSVQLLDGMKVAYQEWGSQNLRKVLALHGWLDNSNSFRQLGPYLADKGFHVVAMDSIGHGWSDHLGTGAFYSIPKHVSVTREFLENLGWSKNYMLCHSMGASIGTMYTAAYNDKVNKLVMIDGFGPLVQAPDNIAQQLRMAIDTELKFKTQNKPIKQYKTLKEAIEQRSRSERDLYTAQYLSREAAKMIVARAVKVVAEDEENDKFEDVTNEGVGPVQFRHDRKQLLPSYIYSTPEQGLAFFHALHTKTLLVQGENGFPPSSWIDFDERVKILTEKNLLEHAVLPGSHHLHLEPETWQKAAEVIYEFLNKE